MSTISEHDYKQGNKNNFHLPKRNLASSLEFRSKGITRRLVGGEPPDLIVPDTVLHFKSFFPDESRSGANQVKVLNRH